MYSNESLCVFGIFNKVDRNGLIVFNIVLSNPSVKYNIYPWIYVLKFRWVRCLSMHLVFIWVLCSTILVWHKDPFTSSELTYIYVYVREHNVMHTDEIPCVPRSFSLRYHKIWKSKTDFLLYSDHDIVKVSDTWLLTRFQQEYVALEMQNLPVLVVWVGPDSPSVCKTRYSMLLWTTQRTAKAAEQMPMAAFIYIT